MKNLTLFVTNKCNSNCIMCFNSNLNKQEKELTFNEYKKISENLGDLEQIFISGGEPSLRKNLAEICKLFYLNCNVKKIRIPMNGQLTKRTFSLVRKVLQLCPNIDLFITLALDGLEKLHDNHRGIKGSFRNVLKTYEALMKIKKRNLKVGFVTTVTKINYPFLEKLTEFTQKLNPKPKYHDLMVCRFQSNKVKNSLLISSGDYKKMLELDRNLRIGMIKNRYGFLKGRLFKKFIKVLNHVYFRAYSGNKTINCKAIQLGRVIESNGDVRICEMTSVLGNLRDVDYNLYKLKVSTELRNNLKSCYCTHPCFVIPSLKYSSNILKSIKSYIFR